MSHDPRSPRPSPSHAPDTADTAVSGEIVGNTQPPTAGESTTLVPEHGSAAPASPHWESLAGQSFGDYDLLAELGRGGMGIVYKARQKSLNRLVALKMLLSDHFRKPTVLSRFLAEAQAAASLTHPNIVTIYHSGQCPAGHYYVMEYVEGQTLDALLEERPIPISWAVSLMIRISEAVHFAHAKGIVHRDLKPANIMIERQRRPVIMDFGIAKFLGKASSLTEHGAILGTPAYMSPEQAREGALSVGPLSDIYSLGATFYKVLTGRVPFDGDNLMSVILKVVSPEPPPPVRSLRKEVSPELERICMKCLSKQPSERYASGHALAEDLRPIRAALSVSKQGLKESAQHFVVPPELRTAPPGSRMVQFVVTEGPDKGLVVLLPAQESLLLGRSQAAETRLSDPNISAIHCHVKYDGNRVLVDDFESKSGTYVNGQRVNQRELRPNDVIQIGGTKLRLLGEEVLESGMWPTTPALPAPGPAPAPLPQGQGQGPAPAPAPPPAKTWGDLLLDIERSAWPKQLSELSGTTFGQYEVGPVIARGHSGFVFRAQDSKHDRLVALKVLLPECVTDEAQQRRFLRSMKAVHAVRHPNIVALFKAGRTGPYSWLATEYVEGQSLNRVLKRLGEGGRLEWRYAYRVALYIGQALDHAHGRKLVHRNITPANIILRSEDKLALLGDLGLARALESLQVEGSARPWELGDISYMAPERTQDSWEEDPRCDIYSLGATLYTLLTGRPPFEARTNDELVEKIRNNQPRSPNEFKIAVPPPIESIVQVMLAKDPEDRHQTAADFLAELDRAAKVLGL